MINSIATNPAPMTGEGASCPDGTFSNSGALQGGCTETYSVSGTFTDADTWTGTYEASFVGPDCNCFDIEPCVDQVFNITAQR